MNREMEDRLYREIAELAEELAFWRYQAFFHRCHIMQYGDLDDPVIWRTLESEFRHIKEMENKERRGDIEPSHDIGS